MHVKGRYEDMDEEDPLTDDQKRVIASLSVKQSSGDRRFRHSPVLVLGILLPVLGMVVLVFALFLPMMMCSGASTAAVLVGALMTLLRSAQLGA